MSDYRVIRNIFSVLFLFFSYTYNSALADLKDPRDRDENITAAEITVSVEEKGSFFEYSYDVKNAEDNKGHILYMLLDLACDLDFGEVDFPENSDAFRKIPEKGYVPVEMFHGSTRRVAHSLTIDLYGKWSVSLDPGEEVRGLRVLSPAPPGPREYQLVPFMPTDGWDYDSYQDVAPGEEEPVIPWIDDFTVVGTVTGPACSLESPEEPERFAGHPVGNEKINKLLTYSEPLRNRLRVDEDQSSVTVTIHFDERIDPETFRVQPAWARRHFDAPRPGGSQTVEVPLRGPRTQLQFEVHPRKLDQPRDEDPYHHSFKDMDVFEIRQGDMKAPPGRERDPQQGGARATDANSATLRRTP